MAENKLEIDILVNDKDALNKLRGALKNVETEAKKSTDSMNLSWAGFAAKLFIAQQALEPVINLMNDAVKAAAEQEEATNRLNNALRLQGTFSAAVSKEFQDMATEMSKNSRFADEAIQGVQQRLIAIGNVVPSQMRAATQASLDLAAVLGIDLPQAASLMAKAAQGETAMLERQLPALKGLINEHTSYAEVLQLVQGQVAGSAQADMASFAATQASMGKAWGEVLEELGGFITKSPAVIEGMKQMSDLADEIADNLKKIREENPDLLADIWENMTKFNPVAIVSRLAGSMAGGGSGFTLVEAMLGTEDQNKEKVAQLSEVVVTAQRTQQEIWLTEQDSKEAAACQKFIEGEIQKIDQLRIVWDIWNNEKSTKAMAQIQAETDFLTLAVQTQQLAHESVWKTAGKERDTFQAGVAGMFKDMVRGTFNAEEAFKQLGLKMVDILIDYAAQLAINTALSKVFSATQVGVSAATATAVAAAWAPAAAAASLATLGSNSAAASAALVQTHALSRTLAAIPGLAAGGDVRGTGAVLVGERGPELLNLPQGARVTPLEKAGDSHQTIININMSGNITASPDAAREFAREIASYVSEFMDNERERL